MGKIFICPSNKNPQSEHRCYRLFRKILTYTGIYRLYERWLWKQIENGPKPSHVAIILDGNRRWASRRGLPPWVGHRHGAKKVKEVLTWLLELNIKTVTLYVLSTENLKRKKEELENLLNVIRDNLKEALGSEVFDKYEVKFKALGKLDLLPADINEMIRKLEEKTRKYNKHFLNIAIAYGGRTEIIEAIKRLTLDVMEGRVNYSDINEELFEKYLFTSHLPNPSPDLIIRTSGEERLSNFLLWQAAYSELCFIETYWPEFRKIDLWRAIRVFQRRKRRFGR